jgi:hypothetical protein
MATDYSQITSCGHCANISQMEIIGYVNDMEKVDESKVDYSQGYPPDYGIVYCVLKCPACSKINIVSYSWRSDMEPDDEVRYENMYPPDKNIPIGLPPTILKAYKSAEKIKNDDVNAYVILLRRLLEMVCIDRNAKGKTLALMLKDLAGKNEIPEKLVNVAKGLKDFGNIGAHAGIGELSEKEIPIVAPLCTAILEYIYSAPYLATIAENKLTSIKAKKKP